MNGSSSSPLATVKTCLWAVVGASVAVVILRYWQGLGDTTAMTDLTPWGLWKGFNVLGGVALAAGGFVVAAAVHIFHLDRYRPYVRIAVLTAWLGYLAAVTSLLVDLGLPWNIWQVIIYWNFRSPMFEVAWCVMLYTVVLTIEFMPVLFEGARHPWLRRLHASLQKATLPLVILGIMLSTLHQSSLGSIFLAMPHRLDPLWYTPLLPILFFVSAVALGLVVIQVQVLLTDYLYGRTPDMSRMSGLGRAAAWVLWAYALLRTVDLAWRGIWPTAFEMTFNAALFWIEYVTSAFLPAVLLTLPAVRRRPGWTAFATIVAAAGIVLHRVNVAGVAMIQTTGTRYIPNWMEFLVSGGLLAGAHLFYFFALERWCVGGEQCLCPPRAVHPRSAWARHSLAFVIGTGVALALVPWRTVLGVPTVPMLVSPTGWADRMVLDGNRSGEAVAFDHQKHARLTEGEGGCARCHHLVLPGEQTTGCGRCHRDMRLPTELFDHDSHAGRMKSGPGCAACHADPQAPRDRDHTTPCLKCHTTMVPQEARIRPQNEPALLPASSYEDAMHRLCIPCHEEAEGVSPGELGEMNRCTYCHDGKVRPMDPLSPGHRL